MVSANDIFFSHLVIIYISLADIDIPQVPVVDRHGTVAVFDNVLEQVAGV
jgi:hypothetical protein